MKKLVALVGLVGTLACGSASSGGAPTEAPPTTIVRRVTATHSTPPTNTPAPTPRASPTPRATNVPMWGPGTLLVGSDIQPGLYVGFAGEGLDTCYFARLSGLSGEFGDILANDNAQGQYFVELKASDVAIELGCPVFQVPDDMQFNILTDLEAGTYLVNRQIQPGRYRGVAGTDIMESCYWARLSGVSGGFGEILANNNAQGQFFIEVRSSDFALEVNCPVSLVAQ